VKLGAVVLVHDDIPCKTWHLAPVEDIISGEDGLIRDANIRTSTQIIKHPITKIYPLELTTMDPSASYTSSPEQNPQDSLAHSHIVEEDIDTTIHVNRRPVHQSAFRGTEKILEWITTFCAPMEMSETSSNFYYSN